MILPSPASRSGRLKLSGEPVLSRLDEATEVSPLLRLPDEATEVSPLLCWPETLDLRKLVDLREAVVLSSSPDSGSAPASVLLER
jgi:hypothetical protein